MFRNMQFTAVMVMTLLTLMLAVLPQRVARDSIADRSRWLMTAGTFLLAVQFALQYHLQLRALGVTQAVMLNLPFFILATVLFSTALLNIQRRRSPHWHEWMVGVSAWVVTVIMLAIAAVTDGEPLMSDTPQIRMAEIAGSVIYALTQGYYSWLSQRELLRMRYAVASYYDREMHGILNWMERSVWLMTSIVVLVPLMIFASTRLLGIFGLLTFAALFYLVICFLCYMVSSDQRLVEIAEAPESTQPISDSTLSGSRSPDSSGNTGSDFSFIESAVETWVSNGGHLRQDLNIQLVANEMHVQRATLSAWLKTTEWEVFATWLTHLRIEEAKKVLMEHPDWSNDYVARHCGFGSRTYFQQKFKEMVGVPPGEFISRIILKQLY